MNANKNIRPTKAEESARENYPGATINAGDKDKNNKCLQDERTRTLNNNPRNNDL